jgi:pimeloyl-ACP methyl ester carboxylesterase
MLASLLLAAATAASPMPSPPLLDHVATLDGIQVHYEDHGPRGERALVLVHGWSCNATFWRAQVPDFASRMRVIAIDLPGHGRSDSPHVEYTQDLFARAVDAVLRDAGVKRAVLVGHSNGTPVIRQFYRLFPQKTAGLVVVDGALRAWWKEPKEFQAFLDRWRGQDARKHAASFIDSMFSERTPAPARTWIRDAMLATPPHVMVSSLEGTGDLALWKPDPIAVPLLVVLAKSPFWTPDYETFVRGLAPQVDWQVLDGVGHFLMVDDPARFNGLLQAFLDRNKLP